MLFQLLLFSYVDVQYEIIFYVLKINKCHFWLLMSFVFFFCRGRNYLHYIPQSADSIWRLWRPVETQRKHKAKWTKRWQIEGIWSWHRASNPERHQNNQSQRSTIQRASEKDWRQLHVENDSTVTGVSFVSSSVLLRLLPCDE